MARPIKHQAVMELDFEFEAPAAVPDAGEEIRLIAVTELRRLLAVATDQDLEKLIVVWDNDRDVEEED